MEAYELAELLTEHAELGQLYYEFLRHDSMSIGIYKIPADGEDPQEPHNEDEVYYVIEGKAQIQVGKESRSVGAGSIVYVDKFVPHKFFAIEEDLTILVFFAPAES